MRKLLLLLMCAPLLMGGSTRVMVLQPQAVVGGPCSTTIAEDFSGTLAKWNDLSGTWSISAGELIATYATGVILYDDDVFCTVNQWVSFQTQSTTSYLGAKLRAVASDLSNPSYVLRQSGTEFIVIRSCQGASCDDIGTWNLVRSIAAGEYFGADVQGTGSSTVFRLYLLGSSDPGDQSTWASPGLCVCNGCATTATYEGYGCTGGQNWTDPTGLHGYADSGLYSGMYSGSALPEQAADNFQAGDWTP